MRTDTVYHESVCDECERRFRIDGRELASTEECVCDACAFAAAETAWRILGRPAVADRFARLASAG